MKKTKRNYFTLLLISIGLLVLAFFGFKFAISLGGQNIGGGVMNSFSRYIESLGAVFSLTDASESSLVMIYDIALMVVFLGFVGTWIAHLILLLTKKRDDALSINLLWFIVGAISTAFLLFSFAYVGEGKGLIYEGTIEGTSYHDFFGFLGTAFKSNAMVAILGSVFTLGSLAAFVLGLISIIRSMKDLTKKGEALVKKNDSENEEEEGEEDMKKPVVIQNIINGEDKAVSSEELRKIVREELAALNQGETETDGDMMTSEDLHNLVREETAAAIAETKFEEAMQRIVAEELRKFFGKAALMQDAPKEEEPKEEPAPEPEPEPEPEEEAQPEPEVKEEPKEEPQPEVEKEEEPAPEPEPEPEAEKEEPAPEPKEEEPAPEPEQEKPAQVIRLTFAEKMAKADQDQMDNYNELKAYALGYGLKSRLSSGGDSFRLHTKTYLRIGMVGKGLKLYFALNPADYKDSTIPVKDVSSKNLYKEIPLCFKVKSGLSVKRAKQLIDDVCGKDGLTGGKILDYVDYASEVKNAVVVEEDGEGEEDAE